MKSYHENRRSTRGQNFALHVLNTKVLELVMEIDTDGNGTIDFHEFINMMKKKSSETDQLEVSHLISFKYFVPIWKGSESVESF